MQRTLSDFASTANVNEADRDAKQDPPEAPADAEQLKTDPVTVPPKEEVETVKVEAPLPVDPPSAPPSASSLFQRRRRPSSHLQVSTSHPLNTPSRSAVCVTESPFTSGTPSSAMVLTKKSAAPPWGTAEIISRPIVFGSWACPLTPAEKSTGRYPADHTHQWKLFVQPFGSDDSSKMSAWCEAVVFKLHESFKDPKRAITQPPYEVQESGWGEFECLIELQFKDPRLKPITLTHLLKLYPTVPPVVSGETELSPATHATESAVPVLYERYEELIFNVEQSPMLKQILTQQEEERWQTGTTAETATSKEKVKSSVQSELGEASILQEKKELMEARARIESQVEELNERKRQIVVDMEEVRQTVERLEREKGVTTLKSAKALKVSHAFA